MTAEIAPEKKSKDAPIEVIIPDDAHKYMEGHFPELEIQEKVVALGFFRKLASGAKEVAKSITRAERGPGGPLNYS